jgi:predicted dehydrogenase
VKILVFGAGSIGRRHITNLFHIGMSDITVADPSAAALDKARQINPKLITSSSDPGKALSLAKFSAVFVCSPPQHHLSQFDAAIEHGAHVFIEKPFTLSCEGAEAILRKADAKKLKVMTAFNMRYLELLTKMKALLDEGRIGRVLGCRIGLSSYMPVWHPDEDYRKTFMAFWKSGGGALYDYVHGIDLVQWLAGRIEKVACLQRTTLLEMETDDVSSLSCITEKGAVCSIYFDFVDRIPRKSLELIGSEGTLIWNYDKSERLILFKNSTGEHSRFVLKENYAQCYIDEIKDFFACISSNRAPMSDGWNGLSTQRVLDMALESNGTGRIIDR